MATKKNQKHGKAKRASGTSQPTDKFRGKKPTGPSMKSKSAKKINSTKKIKIQKINALVEKSIGIATVKKSSVGKKSSYSKIFRSTILSNADVRQQLIEMGGENTINIIREFDANMTDEELARKTSMKASDVRVVLNRLHNLGLFAYTRMRDKDSGWYSYIWTLNEGKLKEFSDDIGKDKPDETINADDGERYCCHVCSENKIIDFETAMNLQFKCNSCGNSLSFFETK